MSANVLELINPKWNIQIPTLKTFADGVWFKVFRFQAPTLITPTQNTYEHSTWISELGAHNWSTFRTCYKRVNRESSRIIVHALYTESPH